jgi:hypothetical protein
VRGASQLQPKTGRDESDISTRHLGGLGPRGLIFHICAACQAISTLPTAYTVVYLSNCPSQPSYHPYIDCHTIVCLPSEVTDLPHLRGLQTYDKFPQMEFLGWKFPTFLSLSSFVTTRGRSNACSTKTEMVLFHSFLEAEVDLVFQNFRHGMA